MTPYKLKSLIVPPLWKPTRMKSSYTLTQLKEQIHLRRVPGNDKLTEVNFFTIDGKFVQKSYSGTIDVSTFKAGVYCLEVITTNSSNHQKK